MQNKELYNYYEMNSYCMCEGINTEFFIAELNNNNGRKSIKKVMMAFVLTLSKVKLKTEVILKDRI